MADFYKYDKSESDWVSSDVRECIPDAIKYLSEESYYSPLIHRYPIKVDEQVNSIAMGHLKKMGAPASTDGNYVYINSVIMADVINKAISEDKVSNRASGNLLLNLATILAHEYIHILCQHYRIGQEFVNKTRQEQVCHTLACEIEANRGDRVSKDSSVYKCAVTDDKYPETKKDKYYIDIYTTLLNMYKDNADSMGSDAQKAMDDKAARAINGDKFKEDKNGDGSSSVNKEKGKKDENKGENENKPQGSDNNGEGNKKGDNNGDADADKELTEEEIEESIRNAMKIVETVERENVEDGSTGANGLDSPHITYKKDRDVNEQLDNNNKRWQENKVKKELKKLKGLIRGDTSKTRVKTYARPSRRPITSSGSLIRKGVKKDSENSPKVLIALDSSGSMNGTTIKTVAYAIENLFKDLGKSKTGSYICMHESTVTDVHTMREWKKVVEKYRPCGGNCFGHVVTKANELGVDVVLNVGDGLDTIKRDNNFDKAIKEFKKNNRQWFDVLVCNTEYRNSYESDKDYDSKNGFDRDCIDLGNRIGEYLNKN